MNGITEDLVRRMAELSRLEVTDEEIARYTHQLNDIVDFASDLPSLDNATDSTVVMQGEDDVVASTEIPADLLRNAVSLEDGFVKVPAILDKGSESA
jgi:aspartyl-tRNA(Asn)/glutamyl-tRNA(Gln) amidotransferase subunit C